MLPCGKERAEYANKQSDQLTIETFRCFEDKKKVIMQKKTLKDSNQYNNVYINHDQPLGERVMAESFRTLLNGLREHGLVMRGSRVVKKDGREQQTSAFSQQPQQGRSSGGGQRQSEGRANSVDIRDNSAYVSRDSHRGSHSGYYATVSRYFHRESSVGNGPNRQREGGDGSQQNNGNRRPNNSTARGRGTGNHRGRGYNNYQRRDF